MVMTFDNRTFVEEVIEFPEPLEDVEGTKTFIGNDFARVRGWDEVHFNLPQTNMVTPIFYLYNGEPVFSKDVLRLDKRYYWVDWFRNWLGDTVWNLYCQPGFGFQDYNDKPTDPINGQFKQQTIDCGCNLRKLKGSPFWTRKGQYQEIEAVSYFSYPNPDEINYKLTPHLITKQTLASVSQVEKVAYISHQKHGDLVWPNLYEHPLVHFSGNLEQFPKLPFETEYLGVPVTIKGLCFQASTVFGLFDDGWRVIEESEISGIGSAFYDRKVYVSNWLKTPPPTIKGWTRDREKFDWQLGD